MFSTTNLHAGSRILIIRRASNLASAPATTPEQVGIIKGVNKPCNQESPVRTRLACDQNELTQLFLPQIEQASRTNSLSQMSLGGTSRPFEPGTALESLGAPMRLDSQSVSSSPPATPMSSWSSALSVSTDRSRNLTPCTPTTTGSQKRKRKSHAELAKSRKFLILCDHSHCNLSL